MGNIIRNERCPECAKMGHDKTGNHLMRFEDGGGYCYRTHFHQDNKKYYEQAGSAPPLSELPITGDIKYKAGEFRSLEQEGKLDDQALRALALGGMAAKERWLVYNETERQNQLEEWEREVEWFSELKRTHLAARSIHGLIAAMYNVRVGHDESGKIVRQYYPRYESGQLVGAKCRTLPKDFKYGHLGKLFGDQDLFGMNTFQAIANTGQKKNFVLVVGGEDDAMAAQQMFIKEINKLNNLSGVSKEDFDKLNKMYIVSVNKGESGLEELIAHKETLNQFRSVIFCFDKDEAGTKLNKEASKLFRGKAKTLSIPNGSYIKTGTNEVIKIKDPNDCLRAGRDAEFVSAIFNAEEAKLSAKVKRVSDISAEARVITEMGEKYWLDGFNLITYGIRLHYLSVWGAGTGVGKTDTTMAHVNNLLNLGHEVVVIYLENQPAEIVKTFAGMLVGKDFNSPPQMQWELDTGIEYDPSRDYTQEDLDNAIKLLEDDDRIRIADLQGSKDVDAVMEVMEECFALGYQYFVVDNLTAFTHRDEKGNESKGVQAIDATMKRLGTFKDEYPVNIMLLSHLIKVDERSGRVPHTLGGAVHESDFRGAGTITFWANAVWGVERNTMAKTLFNRCITLYRNLKNRGIGHKVGSTVVAHKDIRTGKYREVPDMDELPEIGLTKDGDKGQRERDSFDDGGGQRKNRSEPEAESKPGELPWSEEEGKQEF